MLARGAYVAPAARSSRSWIDAEGIGPVRWPEVAVVVVLSVLGGYLAHVQQATDAALVVVGAIAGFISRGPSRGAK